MCEWCEHRDEDEGCERKPRQSPTRTTISKILSCERQSLTATDLLSAPNDQVILPMGLGRDNSRDLLSIAQPKTRQCVPAWCRRMPVRRSATQYLTDAGASPLILTSGTIAPRPLRPQRSDDHTRSIADVRVRRPGDPGCQDAKSYTKSPDPR